MLSVPLIKLVSPSISHLMRELGVVEQDPLLLSCFQGPDGERRLVDGGLVGVEVAVAFMDVSQASLHRDGLRCLCLRLASSGPPFFSCACLVIVCL